MIINSNGNYIDNTVNEIADRFNIDPDNVDITNNGHSMRTSAPSKMLPRELQKKQLIEAFTEPLLGDDNIAPVHPNNFESCMQSLQTLIACNETPYAIITGDRYVGKTTIVKCFAEHIMNSNHVIKLLAGRKIMHVLPDVCNVLVTAEKEAFDAWLKQYRFEDCNGIMLYTDNWQVAATLLSLPGLKIPLIVESGEDFDFSKINVVTAHSGYPVLPLVPDTKISVNQDVMEGVVNDRKQYYTDRFGWMPSSTVIRMITKALSMNNSASSFSFKDTLTVIDVFCSEYASTHSVSSRPTANSVFKFLNDNYGITKDDYNKIPDEMPMRSSTTDNVTVQEIAEQLSKAMSEVLGGTHPSQQNKNGKAKKPVNDGSELKFDSKDSLRKALKSKVIGQDKAIERVIPALMRRKAGLGDPSKPIASLLFAGPSGVGKTELAKAIATAAFGSEDELLRIDCGELSDKWAVSRLLGSMPGYVGSEQGGQLSNFVMKHPNSVLLFDEIEKADPAIYDAILLQLLDAGRITSGKNETVDCTGCIVIMTSNLGADKVADKGMVSHGFTSVDMTDTNERLEHEVMQAVKERFRQEQVNRFDDIIVFNPLSVDDLKSIFDLKWAPYHDRLTKRGSNVTLTPAVREWFATKSKKDKFGARNIIRMMNDKLINPLADDIVDNKLSSEITADIKDGKIYFTSKPASDTVATDNSKK